MTELQVEILELFAEAQAPARAITDEKYGNARAAYLLMKSADNSEQWAKTRADKAKLAARNIKRRSRYDPAKRKAAYLRTGF